MRLRDIKMVNSEIGYDKRKNEAELDNFFREIRNRHPIEYITFLCIGTDRSTGDALGPLVGSQLIEYGIPHVIGCLSSPCDANNLESCIAAIPTHHIVIAVDACLGRPSAIGSFLISNKPLRPAQSVGVSLPTVGHYSVAAVVNSNGPKPYWTLQVTSLYQVMNMAQQISQSIAKAFNINVKEG